MTQDGAAYWSRRSGLSEAQQLVGTSRAAIAHELAATTLCALLRIFCHFCKFFILFRALDHFSLLSLLLLGEAANRTVPFLWCEIGLSFEAAVFERALSIIGLEGSDKWKRDTAAKANRKAVALSSVFQNILDLVIDQYAAVLLAFLKAGCSVLVSCTASVAMLVLPGLLQLRRRSIVSEVSKHRRLKETM